VYDLNGLVRNVTGDDLTASGMTADAAHARARENLLQVFRSKAIETVLADGPFERSFIVLWDHWLAAACAVLPEIYPFAVKHLKTEELCACLPYRGALYIFPSADAKYRSAMRRRIKKESELARKRLSFELFRLAADGLREAE
jgi:hypothetical protein